MARKDRLFVEEFEEVDDMVEITYDSKVDTGRDTGILFQADNLLDYQLMEALTELIKHKNNIRLLHRLQEMQHEEF
ncbi:hypothetical protein KTO58_01170 [Chitinophaga pendula]|uniref:hypothetical protein n=1 Tax=Chitinophaga TaxID=79328 RepID=UPI000BAF08BE|nr:MULTISPECIES: hypothetical protein [Chitinophaga]ASZ14529.1 hypothetical protein CK934_28060 [Chitinophaga sp. MD30]UCJ07816.1 hypothetical protein KTO58_01170 [Chitinophaga pendula]